ncbi:hypothetical protein GCM10023115_50090 [Pontixanthobacter gangjinensis]|uniref:Uncharacterized protein n=1 Tax=Christiangramia aestuarii TaxID=1028746 RepID=A0A7K1LQ23_9FLAO|nr:hypothetical protein [Christiangramia aestuarii]MUP42590.1 hypothetical protein [Christiangramia aestuarii]
MNFGSTNDAAFQLESNAHHSNSKLSNDFNPGRDNTSRILERSRLTEEDLEEFLLNINKEHKKKHRKVLMISALLFISLAVVILVLSL